MSVSGASFSLKKLTDEAYQFDIQFHSKLGKLQSTKEFVFTHQKKTKVASLIDVYSLNGLCSIASNKMEGIFDSKDVSQLKQVVKRLETPLSGSTLLTLDVKGKEGGYLDAELVKTEKSVCQFLSKNEKNPSKSANRAHALLRNRLDYVFCEGTLKATLLHQFAQGEAEFLNSSEGTLAYCHLTEVFMNAAKFGHSCSVIDSSQFVLPISKTPFVAHESSTVWFPKLYKDSCKEIVTLFSPVFDALTSYDESTRITTMTLKELL